jgi:hypothetical protein
MNPRLPHPERQLWYPLDNSAKIFPAIRTGHISAVYRLSIFLTETIDPDILLKALNDILPRFPGFAHRLRPGLFWYYLEPNPRQLAVYPDTHFPCRRLYRKNNQGFLFRILYYENRISIEIFHSLTDGSGALAFLKTLAARYLFYQGIAVPAEEGILSLDDKPTLAEMEDSYNRYARPSLRFSRRQPAAFHLKGVPEPLGRIHVITARMPQSVIREKANGLNVSVNDLLVAAYMDAFSRVQRAAIRRPRRPIVIAVPVNMRRYYDSQTLRNFFQRVFPTLQQGYQEHTFAEILSLVHHSIRLMINEKDLNAKMYANLRSEQKLVLRLVPLFIKNWALKIAFRLYGDSRYTSTLTNLGIVRLPPVMQPYVSGFEVLMGPSRDNVINCAVVSDGQELVVTFSRRIRESIIERLTLTRLVQLGIPVTISSNYGDDPLPMSLSIEK